MKTKQCVNAVLAAAVLTSAMAMTANAFDENLTNYTLGTVTVSANRSVDHFGDTITENSYYRTGGDVKVVTRQEIEMRHFQTVTDAIKWIPGVVIHNPGYRGGQYGYQSYQNGIAINGDNNVIVLVNGHRVNNDASNYTKGSINGSTHSNNVDLNQLIDIEDVSKIEVIKGPGASQYGSDASGGVVNIITRQGGVHGEKTIKFEKGNWDQEKKSFSWGGTTESEDQPMNFFISGSKSSSGNSEFINYYNDEKIELLGSRWENESFNVRLDQKIDENNSIHMSYRYHWEKDGYPLTVPAGPYWSENNWKRIYASNVLGAPQDAAGAKIAFDKMAPDFDAFMASDTATMKFDKDTSLKGDNENPGYHLIFVQDGARESWNSIKENNFDIQWDFHEDEGRPSFVRYFNNRNTYGSRDDYDWVSQGSKKSVHDAFFAKYPTGEVTRDQFNEFFKEYFPPFPETPAFAEYVAGKGGSAWDQPSDLDYGYPANAKATETVKGVSLQLAETFGKHELLFNAERSNAHSFRWHMDNGVKKEYDSVKTRNIYGYLQDKIHMNENWILTPAIRYIHSDVESADVDRTIAAVTGSLHTVVGIGHNSNVYAGWDQTVRPLKAGDYALDSSRWASNEAINKEEGNIFTLGVKKEIEKGLTVGVNGQYTKMSHFVTQLPNRDYDRANPAMGPRSWALDTKQDKKALNITVDKQVGPYVNLGFAVSFLKDKLEPIGLNTSKSAMWNKYYGTTSQAVVAMNKQTPKQHYTFNVSYNKDKLYTGLLVNLYSGMNQDFFTSKRFIVLDWDVNYQFNDSLSAYVAVNNLTNEIYQTQFTEFNGLGAMTMPSRNFMAGVSYKF